MYQDNESDWLSACDILIDAPVWRTPWCGGCRLSVDTLLDQPLYNRFLFYAVPNCLYKSTNHHTAVTPRAGGA